MTQIYKHHHCRRWIPSPFPGIAGVYPCPSEELLLLLLVAAAAAEAAAAALPPVSPSARQPVSPFKLKLKFKLEFKLALALQLELQLYCPQLDTDI